MKKFLNVILLLSLAACFCSCASSYYPVELNNVSYSETEADQVKFAYRYDVLREAGNKKYAKKEDKKDIRLVAVRITNNSGSELVFDKDVIIESSGKTLQPVSKETVYYELKQGVAIYLLYGLVWLTISDCNGYDCNVTPIPVGLVIGGGNMILASSSNTQFKDQLEYEYLVGKIIKNGETVYGLVAVRDVGFAPLSIELKE